MTDLIYYKAILKAMSEVKSTNEYKKWILSDVMRQIGQIEEIAEELNSEKIMSRVEELRDKVDLKSKGLWP